MFAQSRWISVASFGWEQDRDLPGSMGTNSFAGVLVANHLLRGTRFSPYWAGATAVSGWALASEVSVEFRMAPSGISEPKLWGVDSFAHSSKDETERCGPVGVQDWRSSGT